MKKMFLLCALLFVSNVALASDAARKLMEKGLGTHEGLTDFITTHACELGTDKTCDRPLSSDDIGQLKNLLRSLEEWRRLAFEGIVPMATLVVQSPHEIIRGETFSLKETDRYNPQTRKSEKFLTITLNPNEAESKNFLQNARIGLATTLLLYDSYFRLARAVEDASKLRSIIQYDLPDEGPFLSKTYALASDQDLWIKTTQALQFDLVTRKLITNRNSEDEQYFERYILNSFVANRMANDEVDYRLMTALFMNRQTAQGEFFEGLNRFVGALSKLFGNSAGQVQTRDGKLKVLTRDPQELSKIKSHLGPLDILLEKTPMRLTDKFIPGFYGHVAIWLGEEHDLSHFQVLHHGQLIPLLSHPDVTPHLETLSQGKLILEALRIPGVTVNTLEHFMDIDDLVILKAPSMNDELMANYLLKAFQQIGKPYDFNFDVTTEREIVCSELVYTVYSQMSWPTSRSLGRDTINPDQVAWKAVDSCFEPVLMYHDGKSIEINLKQELRRLLELPGGIRYSPQGRCL
jgi:hypothetical protein